MFTSSFVRGVVGVVAVAFLGNTGAACAAPHDEPNTEESTGAIVACACAADVATDPPADPTVAPLDPTVTPLDPSVAAADGGTDPVAVGVFSSPVPGAGTFASGFGMSTLRPASLPGQCVRWGAGIIDKLRKSKKFVAGVGGTFLVIGALADVKGAVDAIKDLLGINSGLSAAEKAQVQALLKDIEAINNLPISEEGKLTAINALLKAAQGVCEPKK